MLGALANHDKIGKREAHGALALIKFQCQCYFGFPQ